MNLLLVHERYGKMAGAEQNIFVTLPHIAKHFDVSYLYELDTAKKTELLDQVVSDKRQLSFSENIYIFRFYFLRIFYIMIFI